MKHPPQNTCKILSTFNVKKYQPTVSVHPYAVIELCLYDNGKLELSLMCGKSDEDCESYWDCTITQSSLLLQRDKRDISLIRGQTTFTVPGVHFKFAVLNGKIYMRELGD